MGVINVTPDSFSDGGRYMTLDAAVSSACEMVSQGADILDIGGESTRPGSLEIPAEEEMQRVIPVIEAIKAELDVALSVDTSKPEVMQRAIAVGVDMINDIRALRRPGAMETVRQSAVMLCLMHMQGQPENMQARPKYGDVVVEVAQFLEQRVQACTEAGIDRGRLIIDPGFGFGKTPTHNVELLAKLGMFRSIGIPLLVGLSRKSMLGAMTGRPSGERLAASVAAATLAAAAGARIIRCHDVGPSVDAMKIFATVRMQDCL